MPVISFVNYILAGESNAFGALVFMPEELLTIAHTAAQLGISERTLRRALREPELQAKLTAVSRHIGGRVRRVSLVNPQLLADLQGKYFSSHQAAQLQASAGNLSEDTVKVYERLIDEQAQRITDLQAALDHERRQSERLVETVSALQAHLVETLESPPPSVVERLFGRTEKPRRRRGNS